MLFSVLLFLFGRRHLRILSYQRVLTRLSLLLIPGTLPQTLSFLRQIQCQKLLQLLLLCVRYAEISS